MSDDRKRMQAIFETLKTSIQSDLNASLTPDDCRELLRMFAMVNMRNQIQSSRPTEVRVVRGQTPVEKIVDGVAELAHGVIEDLAGDLEADVYKFIKPAGRPAKRRRR